MRSISWTPAFAGVTDAETPRIIVIPAKAGIQLGATVYFFNGLFRFIQMCESGHRFARRFFLPLLRTLPRGSDDPQYLLLDEISCVIRKAAFNRTQPRYLVLHGRIVLVR